MRPCLYTTGLAITVVISTLCWQGCTVPNKHSSEIRTLDSLLVLLEQEGKVFDAINRKEIAAVVDTIDQQVKHIQANFVGTMNLSTAIMIDEYRELGVMVPSQEEIFESIEVDLEYNKSQLSRLKKLITEKADFDSLGNKIDDTYIDNAIKSEIKEAEYLIDYLSVLEESNKSFFALFDSLSPKVQALVDSIPLLTVPDERH